jgi:hypothetical protein
MKRAACEIYSHSPSQLAPKSRRKTPSIKADNAVISFAHQNETLYSNTSAFREGRVVRRHTAQNISFGAT